MLKRVRARLVEACARVVLRYGDRQFLWTLHDRVIEELGELHPDHIVHNAGYADGLRFAAEELHHFSWGHPEITMKEAAKIMWAHAKDWGPDDADTIG